MRILSARLTKRTFLGAVASLLGVRAVRAQEVSPWSHQELYWEVVHACPSGHETRTYAFKEDFDATKDTAAGPCLVCYNAWLQVTFPGPRVVSYQPIDRVAMQKRLQDNGSLYVEPSVNDTR